MDPEDRTTQDENKNVFYDINVPRRRKGEESLPLHASTRNS